MKLRMVFVACAALTLSACDHPMFHQDRPGGSDYQGYQPSYAPPPAQTPAYEPPASSENYDRTRERQLWSRCDRGDAEACAARRFQP